MKHDNRSNILFRFGIVIVAILALTVKIVMKLVDNTYIDADKWNARAREVMDRSKVIVPPRGNILAADGSVLATNLNFYTMRIDYRAEKFNEKLLRDTMPQLAEAMAANFPRHTAEEWKEILLKPLKEPLKANRSRSYKVMTGLSHADMELIKTFPFFSIKNPNRNGLKFEKYMRRFNPYGDMARRSIGGVGETTESREIHGISGLEKALDSLLYGHIGYSKSVNLTKNIVDWTDIPPVPGSDIVTTIDIQMQDIVENELNNVLDTCGADWGVAVLMEVKTGDIKAISNLEKNPFGPGYIEARNRAVTGYEPGSVVKTLSMMIAVEDGIVNDLDEVLPTGSGWAYAGGRAITDAHASSSIRVGDVIEQSSNIGMARIITRKYDSNPGAFYSRVKQLGFLEPMNTGIAGELPPRFDSIPNDRGGRIALSRMSYGYATEIPPLYTLAVYNAIANDGVFVRPRLVKKILSADADSVLPVGYMGSGRACSPRTAAIMRQMLTNVVWGDHGTARALRNNTVRIAGKTGTCYMIENGAYNTSMKRLAFCGFFPAEAPVYSCVVLTCHPTKNFFGAARTSGQVLQNVALKLYSRGLLGNSSDYTANIASNVAPTFYANPVRDTYKAVATSFSLPSRGKPLRKPAKTVSGVPDVRGYSLRDALGVLENAGYNVSYSGSGYVAELSPSAGSNLPYGAKVHLRLRE